MHYALSTIYLNDISYTAWPNLMKLQRDDPDGALAKLFKELTLAWQLNGIIFKIYKSSCLKPKGLKLRYLVCSNVYWYSSKIVQILPLVSKLVCPPGDHRFYIEIYRETLKIFLSEIKRPVCCRFVVCGKELKEIVMMIVAGVQQQSD